MPDIDLDALGQYVDAGYTLIPLHKYDRTSTHKGKTREDGKRPVDKDWTNRPYDNKAVMRHAEGGSNVGVRLTAEQLVVDVDPRNMPEPEQGDNRPTRIVDDVVRVDTFALLCDAVGLDPDEYPKVETGSGGLHVYMTKDADVPVLDSVEGYEGVEFKTKGRQVVAAGSIHPNGRKYDWDFLGPELAHARAAPERLMSLIRRPKVMQGATAGGGEHDQQEIAAMLDELDATEFADHNAWLTIMQACHHASNGDARSEFIEWSTRDPAYQDDAWIIGRRWDSLHRDKAGGVTYRTLHKIMRDHGKQAAIPVVDAADDFDDDIELPLEDDQDDVEDHEKKGPLARMNEKLWAVVDGGKFRIMYEEHNPSTGRMEWTGMSKQNAAELYANRRVEKMTDKGPRAVPIFDEWMTWGQRRTAKGVVFDPEREHKNWLNLWQGWAVDPVKGDWSYVQELIRDVLCDGREELEEYVLNWLAFMVQRPWEPPQVAICFRGDKGTGKSTLGEILVALAGRHGLQVTSPRHVTGNFNIHLMDCVFLFADEAVRPTDKQGQSALKALVTEHMMAYEAKGVDLKTSVNRIHVMMASNDDWFVDAGATDGERRYFVTEVANVRQGDRKFFGALRRQMYEEGGLAAMLHDLKLRDISGWEPAGNVPVSDALTEQKLRNLEPVGQWWFNALDSGELPCRTTSEDQDWDLDQVRMFLTDMRGSFEDFCRTNRISPGSMNKSMDRYLWGELKRYCPDVEEKRDVVPEDYYEVSTIGSTDRARCKALPTLTRCRELFEEQVGGTVNWETD